MAPCDVTVTYPAGSNFNLDYYIKTHMPLVLEKWGDSGMTGYNVLKYKASGDGSPSPYNYGATLRFESIEAYEKAVKGDKTAEVFADVANFSDATPTITYAERVAGD